MNRNSAELDWMEIGRTICYKTTKSLYIIQYWNIRVAHIFPGVIRNTYRIASGC